MGLQASLDSCCCATNRNIDSVRYENAKNTCDIINAANNNTRDIIESQCAGFQKVLDRLAYQENQQLRDQLSAAQNVISNNAQTQALISAIRPCAVPAYLTCSPYTALNTGCGCTCGTTCGCGCGCAGV